MNSNNITILQKFSLSVPFPRIFLKLSSKDRDVTGNGGTPALYLAGSSLTINCNIDMQATINTDFTFHVIWSHNSNSIADGNKSSRIATVAPRMIAPNHYQAQLIFTTLSSSVDTGFYTCTVIVDSLDSLLYVEAAIPVSNTANVVVQGELEYVVVTHVHCFFHTAPKITNFSVTPHNVMMTQVEAGCVDSDYHDNFMLVCSARKPALVASQLRITWLYNGTIQFNDSILTFVDNGVSLTSTLHINSARTSHTGLYMCVASIAIQDSPNVNVNGSSTVTIKCEFHCKCMNSGLC